MLASAKNVERLIKRRLNHQQDVIDVAGLAADFRINMVDDISAYNDDTLVGYLVEGDEDDKHVRRKMHLKPTLSQKERNTVIALLLSHYCLNNEKIRAGGYKVTVFDLKAVRENRFSRWMYLATRFALPETIIASMDDIVFSNRKVRAADHFTTDFVFSSVKGPTIQFLLENNFS